MSLQQLHTIHTTKPVPSNNNNNNGTKNKNKNHSHKSSSQSPYHESSDLLNRIFNKIETSSSSQSKHNKKSSFQYHQKKGTNYIQLLKSSVTNKEGKLQVSSKTYAIVTKVLQNKNKIDTLMDVTNILNDSNPIKNMGLFYVMIYELLFAASSLSSSTTSSSRQHGNKIKGGGAVKRYILQYESMLREKYQEYYGTNNNKNHHPNDSDEYNDDDDDAMATENHNHRQYQVPPHRYIRVNTCVTTMNDFLQLYATMRNTNNDNGGTTTKMVTTTTTSTTMNVPLDHIYRDAHIPDVLVIPSHETSKLLSTLTDQNKMNHIVLQDKSSCIPAYCLYSLLQQGKNSQHTSMMNEINVLDACAAPGNKTSHVAALLMQLLQNEVPRQQQPSKGSMRTSKAPISTPPINHTIYAMDRDKERCQILQDRMTSLVPTNTSHMNVLVQNKDFLTIHGHDAEYSNITCIVLDPSCSGSGLYHRNGIVNHDTNATAMNMDPQQHHRIQKLSNFQITCLRHALTSFPNVHTVIYSTCSIHILENEHVVASVFGSSNTSDNDDDENTNSHPNLREEWSIVAPPDLHHWERRGVDLRSTIVTSNDEDQELQDINELYGDLTKDEINCFIRTNHEDRTNGFFVACFQRKSILHSPGKKPKSTSTGNVKKQQSLSECILPIYNGELEQMISPAVAVEDNNSGKRKSRTAISSDNVTNNDRTSNVTNAAAPTNKKRKLEMKQTTTKTAICSPAAAAATTTTAAMNGKKRAKKLEWKQRQHEAKVLRTKSEKANKKK